MTVSPRSATGTRVVLVRHGEAQSAVDRVVGGPKGCTGLSDHGRRQAEALRDRLFTTGELGDVAALYASELPRAIETAEILRPAVGAHLEIDTHCDLCEVHPADEVDGVSWEEVEGTFRWPFEHPFSPWMPGSESWAEFILRTGRKLTELCATHEGQTVVIACHGGVIEASFVVFAGVPLRAPFRFAVDNTSLTEFALKQWQDGPNWTLVRFNDAAHLAGLT